MIQRLTSYLLALAITGCGTGVTTEPPGPGGNPSTGPGQHQPGQEPPPTVNPFNADVLAATQFTAVDAQNDATYLVVTHDEQLSQVSLVHRDVRTSTSTVLDTMPAGTSTPQIVTDNPAGIIWGFPGVGLAAGHFRLIPTGGAPSDLVFGSHAASFIVVEENSLLTSAPAVIYDSVTDCAFEQNDLAGAGFRTNSPASCFMTVEASARQGSFMWLRTDDAPGKSIRFMDLFEFVSVDPVMTGMTSVVGPISNPAAHTAVWITPGSGGAHVFSAADNTYPASPQDTMTIPGTVDAATYIGSDLWGTSFDVPHTLFKVSSSGAIQQFPVDYQPTSLFGLHDRLVIITDEDKLVEQMLPLAGQ